MIICFETHKTKVVGILAATSRWLNMAESDTDSFLNTFPRMILMFSLPILHFKKMTKYFVATSEWYMAEVT